MRGQQKQYEQQSRRSSHRRPARQKPGGPFAELRPGMPLQRIKLLRASLAQRIRVSLRRRKQRRRKQGRYKHDHRRSESSFENAGGYFFTAGSDTRGVKSLRA